MVLALPLTLFLAVMPAQEPVPPPEPVLEEPMEDPFDEPIEEIVEEPVEEVVVEEVMEDAFIFDEVVEEPMLQEPEDPSADPLSAWLGSDILDRDSATARFLHDLEFGVTLDLMTAFTEAAGSVDRYNDLRLRSLQLHFASPVAETGWAFATVDYADGGGRGTGAGSDWVLREGGIWIDQMPLGFWPESMRLEVGKFAADLGAWNTVYANEFPAPSLDGARRTVFGGTLVLTGFAVHQSLPFEDGMFRWSVALAGDVERQDADLPGNGIDRNAAVDPVGRFGIANWAATGRAAAQWDLGGGHSVRGGASLFHAPNELLFTDLPGGGTARQQTRHSTYGVDLGWRWQPARSEQAHEVSVELWVDDNQYRDGLGGLAGDEARAEWAWYEFTYDRSLSFGALVSRHDVLGLSATDVDGHYHAGYATWRFSPANRVSLFLTHTNPADFVEKFYTVGAEWVVDLGAKRANVLPRWN